MAINQKHSLYNDPKAITVHDTAVNLSSPAPLNPPLEPLINITEYFEDLKTRIKKMKEKSFFEKLLKNSETDCLEQKQRSIKLFSKQG